MLRVILRDIANTPQIRLFSSSTCLPLTVPATPKRPSFVIRLMTRNEVKASDRLQKYYYPPYLAEDYSLLLRRYELYPQGSLVACMTTEDVLQYTNSKELPSWAEPGVHNSVVVGFLVFYPWPERFAGGRIPELGSKADLDYIEEAVREKSTLAFGDEVSVGVKNAGIGGAIVRATLAHCRQLGFKKKLGAMVSENTEIWRKLGYKIVKELEKPLLVPGQSITPIEKWYLMQYEL